MYMGRSQKGFIRDINAGRASNRPFWTEQKRQAAQTAQANAAREKELAVLKARSEELRNSYSAALKARDFVKCRDTLQQLSRVYRERSMDHHYDVVMGRLDSADKVVDSLHEINEIRAKYPAEQRTAVGVSKPSKTDSEDLYTHHIRAATNIAKLFKKPVEEHPLSKAHSNEAAAIKEHYSSLVKVERIKRIEKDLAMLKPENIGSLKDLLMGELARLNGSPSEARTHYMRAFAPGKEQRDNVRFIVDLNGRETARNILELAAPEGEKPTLFARRMFAEHLY